ncbi:RidA family protein [Deinococcus budaensis]|uniref:2-iminobutanoate/2-iminopropanoate deaminase n=1 Tax=Deinococcus budaensis TaxID=1665626 RepID=A0A7W8GDT0_9DEIO|nr:RidA family protein [Deinococcus budaensis]MBB5233715.1 2-iminobutanoate/2-iminopropanoate deaminase [Deinococcus budaensis]
MKDIVETASAPAAIGPYSQAVTFGNLVMTSGQIPLTPDGTLVEGGIEAQTRQVLDNLVAVLREAGTDLGRVVKTTVFLADMNEFSAMNAVYAEYFQAPFPARSTVQVARLPRDVRVEIEVIAERH